MADRVTVRMVASWHREYPELRTRQGFAGWVANQSSGKTDGRLEFALTTSEDMARAQPKTTSEAVQRQARAVVQGAIGHGALTRQRPPIQLVTPEVAARLAGTSLAEVLRWHSAGTGPRAYCVAGCWVYRAREVELFIQARGRGSGGGASEAP